MRKSTIFLDRRKRRLRSLFSSWKAVKQPKTDFFILLCREYSVKRARHFMKSSRHVTKRKSWQSAYSFVPLTILTAVALIASQSATWECACNKKKKRKNIRSSATVKRVILNAFCLEKSFSRSALFFQSASPTFINDASQEPLNCLRRCCFNNIKLAN